MHAILIFLSSFQGSSAKGILETFIDNNNESIGEAGEKTLLKIEDFARLSQEVWVEVLLTDPDLLERFRTCLKNVVDRFDCSKPYQMKKIVDVISVPVAKDDSNTVKSIFFDPNERIKRDFCDDRLTQILREVSSQVFYYFRYKGLVKIEEVQSLSVFDCSGILQYMFFAVNPLKNRDRFNQIDELWKIDFQVIITTAYSEGKMAPSEKKRSQRHASKLKERLYSTVSNTDITDKEWSKVDGIRRFVIRHGKSLKSHNSGSRFPDTKGIFLLDPLEKKHGSSLHAEQQFCDLLNINQMELKDCTFQITGKKRPCMGCCGRMRYEKEKFKLVFNEHPGYLWMNHFEKQEIEMRKKTLEVFVEKPSYISVNHEGSIDRSVATESESSCEFDEHVILQIENSERLQRTSAGAPVTECVHNPSIEGTIVANVSNASEREVLNDKDAVEQEKFQDDYDEAYDADVSSESESDLD